ncbi:hypothetical protein [Pseudomonas sp. Tri1]|uniref:hypothetical protein n=1 Tax=Pseudomonas sp. Tri1 TaxID=2823875 RepID=UPI001B33C683|nr:hypothetical protein [Pseudomonas sp. Tri1]
MSAINSPDHDEAHNRARDVWPRDFDFREQYAEQQELLRSQNNTTPAANHPNGEKDA